MSSIITYLLIYNQYLINQIYELTLFIAKHIPIKQWAFDDSRSPLYQKFKIDKLPIIKKFIKQDYSFLLEYYLWKYGKTVKPVQRRIQCWERFSSKVKLIKDMRLHQALQEFQLTWHANCY